MIADIKTHSIDTASELVIESETAEEVIFVVENKLEKTQISRNHHVTDHFTLKDPMMRTNGSRNSTIDDTGAQNSLNPIAITTEVLQ